MTINSKTSMSWLALEIAKDAEKRGVKVICLNLELKEDAVLRRISELLNNSYRKI